MVQRESEPDGALSGSEGLVYLGIGTTIAFVLVLTVGLAIAAAGLTESKPWPGGVGDPGPADGAAIFDQHCASCHGPNGEGNIGPQLAGLVVEKYPKVESQMFVVEQGRGAMPAFGSTLSDDEIRAVVVYEREELPAPLSAG